MDPQLSHYTQFFIVLTNMAKASLINAEQKSFLKNNLIKKDFHLCKVLIANCGPGQEQKLREALVSYLNAHLVQTQPQRRRNVKSKTVHFDKPLFGANTENQPEPAKRELPPIMESSSTLEQGSKLSIDESPNTLNSCALLMMEQLQALLTQHQQKKGLITLQDKAKIRHLRDTLNDILDDRLEIDQSNLEKVRESSNGSTYRAGFSEESSDSEEDTGAEVHKQVIGQITDVYKNLKKIFTGNLHTHLLLMQEDISYSSLFSVLKFMVKILVDADEFTFFIRRETEWEIYQTQNDSIKQVTKEEELKINNEVNFVKPQFIYRTMESTSMYPTIEDLARTKHYAANSFIKFAITNNNAEVLFIYHWSEKDRHNLERKFINHANEYGFTNEVIHLSQFLVETVIQARVQFFNPLLIADKIQDLGISFVRISRYLLVEGIKKALEMHYRVEKEQTFSQEDVVKGTNKKKFVRIDIKDQHPIVLIIQDMDLTNVYEQHIFSDIIRLQEKYSSYVKLCHEKSAFYKYFLRTIDSLLFDFNKKGELIFLSRPISQSMKERFQLTFDPRTIICKKANYQEIFISKDLMEHIEVNIQSPHLTKRNQYLQNQENPQFEIFLKVVEENFKGFAVIFHENQTKRLRQQLKTLKADHIFDEFSKEVQTDKTLELDIQKQIRKSYFKHQTFKFITQLELNNPNIKNSMISLFIPEHERELNLGKRPSRTQSKNSDQLKEGLKASPLRSTVSFQQYPIEGNESPFKYQADHFSEGSSLKRVKQYHKITALDLYEIVGDDIMEQPHFNVFDYPELAQKQRVVYSILIRSNFLEIFQIPIPQLLNFLMELERKYNKRNNPFHNYDHGIAVMQSTYVLCNTKRSQELLSELVKFSTIVSALCHDVGHTARANLFEINSKSKLAIRYHDKSPLEQHHAAATMKILNRSESNILANFTAEDFNTFKKVLIQNILYTDIKEHFNLLKDFENRVRESRQEGARAFGSTDEDLKLFTGMVIHTADFNGGAKVFEVSKIWSQRVNKEFIAQYEEEGQRGIPQTPFLKDLEKLHIMAKSEMGFFKVIVRPLWASLNDFFNDELQVSVNNLDNTIISWEKVHYANLPEEAKDPQKSS